MLVAVEEVVVARRVREVNREVVKVRERLNVVVREPRKGRRLEGVSLGRADWRDVPATAAAAGSVASRR